ncbi:MULTISPECIES: BRO-N domain-containing protein [unclassified Psychrobacter]|uniref:BRO-N domain-containing protein n=1 Tax=unclassified Psychrobacter TaxID=196806 RepID=UPI003FDB9441
MSIVSLSFNNVDLTAVDNGDSQTWFTAKQLAEALGYADDRAVSRIYNKHNDEFTPSMAALVNTTTPLKTLGLATKTRVFSLRGCHLIAMFARSKVAKDFRVWVLDLIEGDIASKKLPLSVQQSLDAVYAIRAIESDKASGHGYGLNKWKGDKMVYDDAINTIMECIQPQLPNLDDK